jgi:hypothetical protein
MVSPPAPVVCEIVTTRVGFVVLLERSGDRGLRGPDYISGTTAGRARRGVDPGAAGGRGLLDGRPLSSIHAEPKPEPAHLLLGGFSPI